MDLYYVEYRDSETSDPWFLRGSTFTSDFNRADTFATIALAFQAKKRAARFLPARRAKKMVIVYKEAE